MILSSSSVLSYTSGQNQRVTTRPLSSRFNRQVRRGCRTFFDGDSNLVVVPSKNLTWVEVSKLIRAGKKVQARVVQLSDFTG